MMRRNTIIEAAERVSQDVIESEVLTVLLRGSREKDVGAALRAFRQLIVAYSTYGRAEQDMIRILGIGPLFEEETWNSVLTKEHDGPDRIMSQLYIPLQACSQFLPKFAQLLKIDRVERVRENDNTTPEILRDKEILTVILPESEDQYSSPLRVAYVLEAIDSFYSVEADLHNLRSDDLVMIACDSGSDKSFDFTGLPQLVGGVKEIIFGIWDRIVFHRHTQTKADLELIVSSLPVIASINSMKKNGEIAPELSEQLRRRVAGATGKFVNAGATIPELDERAISSPRARPFYSGSYPHDLK